MALFQKRIVKRTTVLSVGFLACIIGVFLAYYGLTIEPVWVVLAACISILLRKPGYGRLCAVAYIFCLLGVWRGSAVFHQLQRYDALYGNKVTLHGVVSDDAGFNEQRKQTEFHVSQLNVGKIELIGRVQVATREDPKVHRGDTVIVSGKLKPSKGTSRQGSISMANVSVVQKNTSTLESVRRKFFASVSQILPEPQASLGIGYLVGLRVNIPKELSDQLAIVGLTHIIAVSGYNVTILVKAVRRLLAKGSAYQSLLFSLLLVGGFVAVAGGSASINRAAVVCVVSLFAWYYGRALKPILILLFSGAVTGLANPLYVWGDPGWWLSFLAFAGVLIVAPLVVKRYFSRRPPGTLSQILIETICAQLCTIPYTMYLFGSVSVIAPLANVLVLPFIPFIMFTIFVLGIIGMLSPAIAVIGAFIPRSLLSFQLWIVERLSKISWAHYELQISAIAMGALFVFLAVYTYLLWRRIQRMSLESAEENEYNLV